MSLSPKNLGLGGGMLFLVRTFCADLHEITQHTEDKDPNHWKVKRYDAHARQPQRFYAAPFLRSTESPMIEAKMRSALNTCATGMPDSTKTAGSPRKNSIAKRATP